VGFSGHVLVIVMQILLQFFFLLHSPVVESSARITFDTVLGVVFEGGSDLIEFIFLPLSDSSFHDKISVSLPSDYVLPFLKSSS